MEKITKSIICTVCPIGCNIEVELTEKKDNKEIISITGNTCKRGLIYAQNECINPKRTLTTTVFCDNGKILSVKTNTAVPKDLLFECMKEINKTVAKTPVKIGEVIIENILNTGADVVACANIC